MNFFLLNHIKISLPQISNSLDKFMDGMGSSPRPVCLPQHDRCGLVGLYSPITSRNTSPPKGLALPYLYYHYAVTINIMKYLLCISCIYDRLYQIRKWTRSWALMASSHRQSYPWYSMEDPWQILSWNPRRLNAHKLSPKTLENIRALNLKVWEFWSVFIGIPTIVIYRATGGPTSLHP